MSKDGRIGKSGWILSGCGAAACGMIGFSSIPLSISAAEPAPPTPTADVAPASGAELKSFFPGEAHLLAAMDRVEGALKSTETSIQQIEAREALVESSYAHALIQSPAAKVELLKAQRQLALFRQSPDRAALRKAGEYLSLALRLAPAGENDPVAPTPAVAPPASSSTSISSPQTTLVPRTLRSAPAPTASTWPPAPAAPTAVAPAPAPPTNPALAATTATTYDWNSTAPQAPPPAPQTKTEVHYHYPAPPPPPVVREEIHVYPGYGYYPYHYHRPHYHYHPRPVYVPPPGVSVGGSNWRLRVNF